MTPLNPTGQKAPITPSKFSALADDCYLREADLVTHPDRPNVAAVLPFSAPTLWRKVKNSDFPKPVKLGARITAWRVGDVRSWLAQRTAESAGV